MKNYCDYDSIVHYSAGQFSSKYKTNLSGKLREVSIDCSLSENDINSFRDGYYKTYVNLEPLVLYRIYGQYQKNEKLELGQYPSGARLKGRYVSTEFAESAIDAKMRLALDSGWLNTKMFEAKLLVPEGTKLSIGIVASITLSTGTILPGGEQTSYCFLKIGLKNGYKAIDELQHDSYNPHHVIGSKSQKKSSLARKICILACAHCAVMNILENLMRKNNSK